MLHVISDAERGENQCLLDQMYSLRAKQFQSRRSWQVCVTNGMEIDQFDAIGATYVIVSDGRERLLASLRILPTIGQHMLADVFPDIMGSESIIRHPLIWESSRFCVDTDRCRAYSANGVNMATKELLHGLFRTALDAGLINIVSVYDVFVERILRRAGCKFDRLGRVVTYDMGLRTTAGLFEVSPSVVNDLAHSALSKTAKDIAA
ncbi:acyl-homoserine-lactone synthase [uncultured Tateyamaria sp.]|uniref:acyl-homoserine-lactone synthase n=1 Tax=uncultured Tateyamaria sp. TaxID=455651 RepID=UPI0026299E0E|nr:acyl-homoserine-lactone synthase [uncultured Tateyamaria sp.]